MQASVRLVLPAARKTIDCLCVQPRSRRGENLTAERFNLPRNLRASDALLRFKIVTRLKAKPKVRLASKEPSEP